MISDAAADAAFVRFGAVRFRCVSRSYAERQHSRSSEATASAHNFTLGYKNLDQRKPYLRVALEFRTVEVFENGAGSVVEQAAALGGDSATLTLCGLDEILLF